MRRTKLVCTIGPACDSEDMLQALIEAGMNVARINFSHGGEDYHRTLIRRIRTIRERMGVYEVETAPLLGLYLGRIRRAQVVDAVRSIVILQKENGERKDRRQARWKYTIRRLGLDAVRKELGERFGIEIEESEAVPLPPMELHLGWHEMRGGGGWYGVSVENGRLKEGLRAAVREAVETLGLQVRFTPQQDLLLIGVEDAVSVRAASLSADGRSVFLEFPVVAPVMQMEVRYDVRTADRGPAVRERRPGAAPARR